jgi:hypothetical protein
MNEELRRSRQEVMDWLRGPGSWFVLIVATALLVMFVLAGVGVASAMWAVHLLIAAGLFYGAILVVSLLSITLVSSVTGGKERKARLRSKYSWMWRAFPPVVWDGESSYVAPNSPPEPSL